MKVTRVVAERFMSHDSLDVTLPATGVVLVTGHNGAGKSAIMEAVAFGTWGKTLRGADPRRDGEAGSVLVDADLVTVHRSWKGTGSAKLEVVGEEHENSTKAQDRVANLLSWDVWRRSCAFSSADAAHFTMAADADRKRLLEAILGLDRLDRAHEAARKDLRNAEQLATAGRLAANRILGAIDTARRNVALRSTVPAKPGMTLEEAKAAHDQALLRAGEQSKVVDRLRERTAPLQLEVRGAELVVADRLRTVEKLSTSECPTCARPFDVDGDQLTQARREHAAAITAREAAKKALDDHYAIGQGEAAILRPLVEEAKKAASFVTYMDKEWFTYNQAAALLAEAETALGELDMDLMDAEFKQAELDGKVAMLEACCQVLGTRGVRSQVLATALADLESAANRWLHEIGDRDLEVVIRPQVERASGTVADIVTLEVLGAGGGRGYKGASAGERRRIDVALMLGLAEMAGRAHGTTGATLFFDEVFDALDATGARAVAQALGKLAADRAVVCISHSPALAAELHPVLHVRVESGVAKMCSR